MARRVRNSVYIEWAKTLSQSKFNLATSGVMHYPLSALGISVDQIELSGPSFYGYQPLQESLAKKCDVRPQNVVAAIGTSMANHLAMAALVEPGDEVLIEAPAYDPLLATAEYLGATVKRFERKAADGFRIDPQAIDDAVSSRTR